MLKLFMCCIWKFKIFFAIIRCVILSYPDPGKQFLKWERKLFLDQVLLPRLKISNIALILWKSDNNAYPVQSSYPWNMHSFFLTQPLYRCFNQCHAYEDFQCSFEKKNKFNIAVRKNSDFWKKNRFVSIHRKKTCSMSSLENIAI